MKFTVRPKRPERKYKSHIIGKIFTVLGNNDIADILSLSNAPAIMDRILPCHPGQIKLTRVNLIFTLFLP
jgi:hypothetical protein